MCRLLVRLSQADADELCVRVYARAHDALPPMHARDDNIVDDALSSRRRTVRVALLVRAGRAADAARMLVAVRREYRRRQII